MANASVEKMSEIRQSSEEFLKQTVTNAQAAEVARRNVEATEHRRVMWRAYKKIRNLCLRYRRQKASILQEANVIQRASRGHPGGIQGIQGIQGASRGME